MEQPGTRTVFQEGGNVRKEKLPLRREAGKDHPAGAMASTLPGGFKDG